MNKLEVEWLRDVGEDDVEKALVDASFGDALSGIDTAVLVELYQRVLDGKFGEDELVTIPRLDR